MKLSTEDAALHRAAVRAGLRTAAQSARGAGVAILGAIGTTVVGVEWGVVAGIAGASAITVAWAGLDAYLGVIEKGVPAEYTVNAKDDALAGLAELDETERLASIGAASSRVELRGRHAA